MSELPEQVDGQLVLPDGRCDAWCWTHDQRRRGIAPVRRCSRDGYYEPARDAILCTQHSCASDPCLSEDDAKQRRLDARRDWRWARRQRRREAAA